jgi:hypothetical protein
MEEKLHSQIFGSEKAIPSYDEVRVHYSKYHHEIYSIYVVRNGAEVVLIIVCLVILGVERFISQR